MTEQAEPSVVALRARRSALASRCGATADADRVLAQVLADAHAARREGIRRLDAIAEEVDRAVRDCVALAADTPLGARELLGFLVAKLREIRKVVADAQELSHAKTVVLEGLRATYGGPNG